MQWLKKIWRWIRSYWYIPLFVLGLILGWVIFRKRGGLVEQAKTEVRAAEAAQNTKEIEAVHGYHGALADVNRRYRRLREKLTVEQEARAEELENEPQKLAKFLVRAAGRG